jgi:hypothetical protein
MDVRRRLLLRDAAPELTLLRSSASLTGFLLFLSLPIAGGCVCLLSAGKRRDGIEILLKLGLHLADLQPVALAVLLAALTVTRRRIVGHCRAPATAFSCAIAVFGTPAHGCQVALAELTHCASPWMWIVPNYSSGSCDKPELFLHDPYRIDFLFIPFNYIFLNCFCYKNEKPGKCAGEGHQLPGWAALPRAALSVLLD